MRKTTKSVLYKIFEPTEMELYEMNCLYVVDGGYLLHRVKWNQGDTFKSIVQMYLQYLKKHFGEHIVVVFDG